MKIKNLKYVFGFLFWLISFVSWITFWACTSNMEWWNRLDDLPGDWYHEWECWSYAQPGTNSWYDNHQTLSNDARAFIKMTNLSWADCNHSKVVAIQQKMQNLWPACSTCVDGRLWKHTTDAMSSTGCHELICPNPAEPATWNWSSLDCSGNYVLKTLNGNWCCVEAPTLGIPEMEQNSREQYLNVSIFITVSDDYFDDDVMDDISKISASNSDWPIPSNKISVSCSSPYGTIQCDLDIHVTWSDVTLTLEEWFFKLEVDDNIVDESSQAVQTFTWIEPQDCGSTPNTESGCEASYWPSYSLSGDCCVTQCSTPQKTWWGCNDASHIVDGSGCCVQNNCQNPPLTWTDCSNQFWWRWVYSGAIQCCVDSGSCVNPPSSPWQCSWNLVLDQAGQCCITCATPADGSWNCQSWYTVQWSCCFADNMCWDSWYNAGWQCIDCTWDTMPNPKHTRCICNPNLKCCWVQLNNVVPFIWDCIEMNGESNRDNTTNVTSVTAFPILMQWLMKILMSVIMIFSFLMIIVAWLMIVSWAFGWNWFTTGKKIIKNVIISLILLGCSWLILSLINPSFFGG